MIILEKPFSYEEFYFVKTLEDIKNSPNGAVLVFKYCDSSLELYDFCKKNEIDYAVIIETKKELIFCENLGAKYVFCDTIKKAKEFQKIVDNYLMNLKIVYLAESLDEIETVCEYNIDAIKLKGKK